MRKAILILCLVATYLVANAQLGAMEHAAPSNHQITPLTPQDGSGGNGFFSENFNMTACGLNYTAGSVRIETRYNYQTSNPTLWGYGFNAGLNSTLTINGAVQGCLSVTKAYMYWTESAISQTVSNYAVQGRQIMTFTDPLNNTDTVSGYLIGTGSPKCWEEQQTMVFRADVTPYLIANGGYNMISLSGVSDPNWEVDGVTIIAIYQDASATYEGTLVIDDGNISRSPGDAPWYVNNFSVCGRASNGRGFIIASDLQSDAGPDLENINGFSFDSPLLFWEDDDMGTNYTPGQDSAYFDINTSNDCYTFAVAGVYYQTECLGCTPSGLQVLLASVNTSCDTSQLGTASVTISSGVPPYTIDWSTGVVDTTSISGLMPGNYSATVTDSNGCSTVVNFVISVGISNLTYTNAGCPNFNNGTASVNPSGNGPFTFMWSNGSTMAAANSLDSGLVPGIYYVTITDSLGCSWVDSVTILGIQPPSPVINGLTAICQGSYSDLYAGNYASYMWSTGETSAHIYVDTTGTYCVTVTTQNNCTGTACITVTVSPIPIPTITQTPSSLCGPGFVTLDAGYGYSSYTWNNAGYTETINPDVSATTTYTVTVINGSGCAASASATVTVFPLPDPAIIVANGPTSICPGTTDSLTAEDSNTGGPYAMYMWNDGETTQTIAVTPSVSTQYCVTVTDNYGCTTTACIVIGVYIPPTPAITYNGASQFCPRGFVVLDAGSYVSYLWGDGESTETIDAYDSIQYCVTVTDDDGCTGVACINVTADILMSPLIMANGPTTFCAGNSVTLDAGAYASYMWSDGETTEIITVDSSGTYCVTATDANNCTGVNCIIITVNPNPTPAIYSYYSTSFCSGNYDLLYADEFNNYSSYLWNTGAVTSYIYVYSSDTYCVTVSDDNGCTGSSCMVITENPNPTPSITETGNVCTRDTATLDGGGPYLTYLWSTGATTETINVTTGGYYYLTVTDSNGCTGYADIYINPQPTVTIAESNSSDLCDSASLTLQANSSEYTQNYTWSTGETTQIITVTTPGTYTVTITGYYTGCTATDSITLSSVGLAIIPGGPTSFCQGGDVFLSPGDYYESYIWSDSSTSYYLYAYTTGTYCVTVTDFNGCTAIACINVTENPLPTPVISGPSYICDGNPVTLDAGPGYAAYDWYYSGQTTQTIEASTLGYYYVTVTTAYGCTAYAYTYLNQDSPSESIYSYNSTSLCDSGSVSLDAGGGWASYIWSNGNTDEILDDFIHATTNYCVTVTDINGCMATACIQITVNTVSPEISSSGPTTFCDGNSLMLDAGSWVSYSWNTGDQTEDIFVSTTGTYCVTVMDENGCTGSACVSVNVNPNPSPSITPSGPTTFCSSSSVTLDAGSVDSITGVPYATYTWSTGETTETITVSSTGLYCVTVTDINGCTGMACINIVVNPAPAPIIVPNGPTTFCSRDSVTLDAGLYASYMWSDGETKEMITVNSTATYCVTVMDDDGCTGIACIDVSANSNLTPTITPLGSTTFCEGGSVILFAGEWSSYLWSTGDTTQAIVATSTGTYCVTVMNTNGCSGTACINVTVNPNPTPSITPSDSTTFCAGGSVMLDAGSYASYIWNDGETTEMITVSSTGTYCVTVTDNNTCTGTACVNVTVNPNPTPVISPNGPISFCSGDSVSLDAGAYTSYMWSGGETTEMITVDSTVSYCVTVMDANGCSGTACIDISANANLSPIITPSRNTNLCVGDSVTLDASLWTSYSWSTGDTTESITVSTSATYCVTVMNASGCSGSACLFIAVYENPNPILTGATFACFGNCTVLDAGGYTSFLWNDNTTNETDSACTTGQYCVTVTDINGCTGVACDSVLIIPQQITGPLLSSNGTSFCNGDSTILSVQSQLWTSYLWSDGSTTYQSNEETTSGNYCVTVSEQHGCTASNCIQITVNSNPAPVITGPTSSCQGDSVTLSVGSYVSYLWSTGETTQSITVFSTDIYYVTVTDSNGCMGSNNQAVTFNANPTPGITPSGNTTFCAGSSVSLDVGSYASYLWSDGETTETITVNSSGSYCVTATDGNTCTGTACISITVNPSPSPIISPNGSTTFCDGNSVMLDAGTWVTYLWSNSSSLEAITATTTGTYCVTVTDTNNCSGSTCINVTVNPNPIPVISGPTTACQGDSVTLTVGTYSTYLWSTGETTQSITVDSTNVYYVTVTDSNGCSGSTHQAVTIQVNPIPVINPDGTTTFCQGGSVNLCTIGTYTSYLWSDGTTTQCDSGIASSGNYCVTVSFSTGCTGTTCQIITVNPNPVPTISPNGPTTFCDGDSVMLSAGTWNSYSWSTGDLTEAITVDSAGTYCVTVTDANSCNGSTCINVTVNPNPTPSITPNGPTSFCNGDSVGLDVGSYASYLWNTGATTEMITAYGSQPYCVTVTDANGCTGTACLFVTVYANPTPTISGSTTICSGGTTTLSAGDYASYLWSTGETTDSITVNAVGTYTVTVTTDNGCMGTGSVTVTIVTFISPAITGATTSCQGDTVTLTTGSYSSYMWSNGATTQSINVTTTAIYSVTVNNGNGCTGTAHQSVTFGVAPAPIINPSGPTTFCSGGSVDLTVINSYTSYLWSNGATTQGIGPITTAGDYCVTVSYSNGCTGSACDSITITNSVTPVITPGTVPAACTATSMILGANSGFISYLWNTGATTQYINIFAAGTYTVSVTSQTNCTGSASYTTTNFCPKATVAMTTSSSFTNCASTTLNASAGYASYAWSNGATTQTDSVTTSGTYTVTVTSACGCTASVSHAVTISTTPAASINAVSLSTYCEGTSNLTLTASANTSYIWNTGATTQSITLTPGNPGTYSVTVTNAGDCTNVGSIVVSNACSLPTFPPTPTTNIAINGGMANWIEPSCYYGYTLEISLHNANVWTSHTITPNTHYMFSGLTANTEYDWRIQTNCNASGSINSGYSAIQTFTTLARLEADQTTADATTSFNVYPNPAQDLTIVEFSSIDENNYNLRLVDVLGRTILSQDRTAAIGINQVELNLGSIAKGVYFIILDKGDMRLQAKVAVQ